MATRNIVPLEDSGRCPWCGKSAYGMVAETGLGYFQALEAHVQECEPARRELEELL